MARYIDEKDVYALVGERGMSMVHCAQIDALPRADIEPRSEGEWLDTGDEKLDKIYSGYKCSACGFIICGHSGKYCCECGAKMKGGAE